MPHPVGGAIGVTCVTAVKRERFLLGTGRMPHSVGGAMGVTLCHCHEKGNTRLTSSH